MQGMLVAKTAILLDFHPIGMIFLFLGYVVVALLAIQASQSNLSPHVSHPTCD
jgi:hypothetical protein